MYVGPASVTTPPVASAACRLPLPDREVVTTLNCLVPRAIPPPIGLLATDPVETTPGKTAVEPVPAPVEAAVAAVVFEKMIPLPPDGPVAPLK